MASGVVVWVVLSSRLKDLDTEVWVDAVFSQERTARAYVAAQGKWAPLFWVERHQVDLGHGP